MTSKTDSRLNIEPIEKGLFTYPTLVSNLLCLTPDDLTKFVSGRALAVNDLAEELI